MTLEVEPMSPRAEGEHGCRVPHHQKRPRRAGMAVRATSDEAAKIIRQIGAANGPAPVKVMIGRAADALGWAVSRAKHIWYRTAHRITADEIDALRSYVRALSRNREHSDGASRRERESAIERKVPGNREL